jgi:hypothetical protein
VLALEIEKRLALEMKKTLALENEKTLALEKTPPKKMKPTDNEIRAWKEMEDAHESIRI